MEGWVRFNPKDITDPIERRAMETIERAVKREIAANYRGPDIDGALAKDANLRTAKLTGRATSNGLMSSSRKVRWWQTDRCDNQLFMYV